MMGWVGCAGKREQKLDTLRAFDDNRTTQFFCTKEFLDFAKKENSERQILFLGYNEGRGSAFHTRMKKLTPNAFGVSL